MKAKGGSTNTTDGQVEPGIAQLDRQIRVRRLEIAQLDATICGPFWWPLRQDNPDMEREIAAVQARMAQPLSKEQIVAYELWAQMRPPIARSLTGCMSTGGRWRRT